MSSYYGNFTASAQILTYDYGFAGGGPGRGDQYNVQDGTLS